MILTANYFAQAHQRLDYEYALRPQIANRGTCAVFDDLRSYWLSGTEFHIEPSRGKTNIGASA